MLKQAIDLCCVARGHAILVYISLLTAQQKNTKKNKLKNMQVVENKSK